MTVFNPIGKTLKECTCLGYSFKGYSVFVLQDDFDNVGKRLDEDISIKQILKKHPEYADYKVKFTNDFFGSTVFRVIKGE